MELLNSNIRYFTNEIIVSTSAGDEIAHQCRVIDERYVEFFNIILFEDDELKAFEQIMESDKGALLYRTHYNKEIAGLANWKIDKQQKKSIKDATRFP